MADLKKLNHPWLVAVWPGMGGVAVTAGYYLLSKLEMDAIAEYEVRDLFDIDQVDVKDGIIQPAHRPRNRLFLWPDPQQIHDIVAFLGEAQPPIGKYQFCRNLIGRAREMGVERVITFAAMATEMHPEHPSRVFGAATDEAGLGELRRLEVEVLEGGHIGGLNGVLLAASAEGGLPGVCLLGEMPHIFHQFPFPKASLAILEAFTAMARLRLDFTELAEQARAVEQQLGELLARVEQASMPRAPVAEKVEYTPEPAEDERLTAADRRRIDDLFGKAAEDRSKAFELKQELDRVGVFREYEDRFLDLFKKPS
jgi:proteasome assembly chaperone (PAC2) family protein